MTVWDQVVAGMNNACAPLAETKEAVRAVADAILAERERCAKIADRMAESEDDFCDGDPVPARLIAERIRSGE